MATTRRATTSTLAEKPPKGMKCQEAASLSLKHYIPCGRPAFFIVRNKDPKQYAMCDMCTDHNVENRGASIVKQGEKYELADLTQPTAKQIAESLAGPLSHDPKNSTPELDIEEAPAATGDQLKNITNLAKAQIVLLAEIAAMEDVLTAKKQALKANQETDLPEAMTAAGMKSFELTDKTGAEIAGVTIKEIVAASITKANLPRALPYMEKHAPGLIKRVITVKFGKDDDAWAKKFMADMAKRKKKLDATVTETVNPQSLGAWVREKDAANEAVDEKLLGVFRVRKAIVDLPSNGDDINV